MWHSHLICFGRKRTAWCHDPLVFFCPIFQVEHFFRHRINSSVIHASDYLKQPSPIISVVAKFISFIAGGFAAVLIIIAFLDASLLEGHVLYLYCYMHMHVYIAIFHPILWQVTVMLNSCGCLGAIVLVCSCIWYNYSYQPSCYNGWAPCSWPRGHNVLGCLAYSLHAQEMA